MTVQVDGSEKLKLGNELVKNDIYYFINYSKIYVKK